MKAGDVYRAVPWQVQLAAVGVGLFLYVGYRASKRIKEIAEDAAQLARDAPALAGQALNSTYARALDANEMASLRIAQYGTIMQIVSSPTALAIWTELKTRGYYTTRTGEVFYIPPSE